MKKLLVAIALAVPAQSQAFVDFNEIVHSVRVGAFVDQHLNNLEGVYATILNFHDSQGVEYVDLNGGYLKEMGSSKGSPLFEVGFRLDNLLARARYSDWGRRHTTLSDLPTLEFGPFAAISSRRDNGALRLNLLYGIGLAVGF